MCAEFACIEQQKSNLERSDQKEKLQEEEIEEDKLTKVEMELRNLRNCSCSVGSWRPIRDWQKHSTQNVNR